MVDLEQAGRGQQYVQGQLRLAEDAQHAGIGLRGGNEQFERAAAAQAFKVYLALQHVAQRVQRKGVELRGREVPDLGPESSQG
jgi:hypothetical protein